VCTTQEVVASLSIAEARYRTACCCDLAGGPRSDYCSVCTGSRAICALMNSISRECGVVGKLIRARFRPGGNSAIALSSGSPPTKMPCDASRSCGPRVRFGFSTAAARSVATDLTGRSPVHSISALAAQAVDLGRPIAIGFYTQIEAVRPKNDKGRRLYGIGRPSFPMPLIPRSRPSRWRDRSIQNCSRRSSHSWGRGNHKRGSST